MTYEILAAFLLTDILLCPSCRAQLKEFQQKSSPASVAGEKSGAGSGGAGAKKKRKVKGLSQLDASSTERNSSDNVSQSCSFFLSACHSALAGQVTATVCS